MPADTSKPPSKLADAFEFALKGLSEMARGAWEGVQADIAREAQAKVIARIRELAATDPVAPTALTYGRLAVQLESEFLKSTDGTNPL